MKDDPIVAEVRRVRDQLAREVGYDVRAICADLMARQRNTVSPDELRQTPYPAGPLPAVPALREKPPRERGGKR